MHSGLGAPTGTGKASALAMKCELPWRDIDAGRIRAPCRVPICLYRPISILYRRFSLACSARAAPIAVFTSLRSSGGGSTAFIPRDSIQSSRHQPRE